MIVMKSLVESLFDGNLINKDLPGFLDDYIPVDISTTAGAWPAILDFINLKKLEKISKPYDLKSAKWIPGDTRIEPLEYIVGIINNLPAELRIKFDKCQSSREEIVINQNIFKDLFKGVFTSKRVVVFLSKITDGTPCINIQLFDKANHTWEYWLSIYFKKK